MATCSSADSVLEAASLIKSNSTKLNTFVNGTSTETVQLGASTDTPTPTLRNLVANALEHVAESMEDSIEAAVTTLNELENGKADKVNGDVEDHIAALDAYGNLQDSGISMTDVAKKSTDIASLSASKADKVDGATSGNFAGLNASGNLVDSGKKPSDITDLQTGKANKVPNAVLGNFAGLSSSGDITDSGMSPSNINALATSKADKVMGAVNGNFAGLDASGNLTDSGRSPADITALEEEVDRLDDVKADKFVPADVGNLAKLSSDGNLRDAGRAVEDFVPLLAYANGEAIELATMNRMNIASYNDWHKHGIERVCDAGLVAGRARDSIRTWIDSFDESVSQCRLMNRLFDGTNPGASSKPVLFVISGQSNGVGYDAGTKSDSAVGCGWFWSWKDGANTLKPLKDPTGENTSRGSGWCQFARRFYALTGRKIILLNIANGGAGVADDGTTTANTWADNGYGTLRSSRQTIWNAFHAAVPASSYDVGAILWVQGEHEASGIYAETITVQDYKAGTLDVFEWTRNLIGAQDCPVFFGKIGYNSTCLTNASLKACYDAIQKAEDDMCNNEDIFMGFSMAPEFALPANAGWWAYMSDSIHYSHLGYKIYGNAFARSVVNYLNF